MLIHAMAECFNLSSFCSNANLSENQYKFKNSEKKFNKYDTRSQDNAKIRDVLLMKTEESRAPILTFRDYFTQSQILSHNLLFPQKIVDSPDEEIVKNKKNRYFSMRFLIWGF